MNIHGARHAVNVAKADLSSSRFDDVNLQAAEFTGGLPFHDAEETEPETEKV